MDRTQTIPAGYCQCGCGGRTNLAPKTCRRNGWVKGQPMRFVRNHNHAGSRFGPEYLVEDRGHETPCWIWQRLKDAGGYGRVWRDGQVRLAHRVYYETAKGAIPGHLEPDHLCRQRACVNPDHLEPVPRAINVRRGSAAKLTQENVDAIRASGATHADLARAHGVHPSTILRIRRFEKWRP